MRDLEIALVLAREMKAAAARSVEASLRLDQLQEVFGVERLDHAERARIQTALQMAGLEPFPSLLEADPTEPIRFGASKAAAGVTAVDGGAGSGGGETEAAVPDEPPSAAPQPPPTFPTVGEFARSKLGGSGGRRRFGLRRGDHGEGDAPPPPPPDEEYAGSNGWAPEADETQVHHEVLPDPDFEPVAEFEDEHELELHEPELENEPELHDPEPAGEVDDEPVAVEDAEELELPAEVEMHDQERVAEVDQERVAEVDEEASAEVDEEPVGELDPHDPEFEEPGGAAGDEPVEEAEPLAAPDAEADEDQLGAAERVDEREYIPLVPDQPMSYAPVPQPVAARSEDLVAALLPAVAIPVIVTSLAGWRFGLPFVALSVIATGWLLSRRKPTEGEKTGLFATLRRSPAAVTALKTTAIVTALSGVAAVVLATVGRNSSTSSDKTASPAARKQSPKPAATASKPATPSKPSPAKHRKKPTRKTTPAPAGTSSQPPPDPATQGLVRVPPQSAAPTTGPAPNGTATQPGTGTTPGTGQATP